MLTMASEEDAVPSLPDFDEVLRSLDHRGVQESRASILSSDDTALDDIYNNSTRRPRRLSTVTTTSIGRPRQLATRPKIKEHDSRDAVTFIRDTGTRELSSFLWTHNPPSSNWASDLEEDHARQKQPWLRRRKTVKSEKPVLQLPDCAVATKTKTGQWYIAIHIPMSQDSYAVNSQSRVKEIKDSDTTSIRSSSFSKATSSDKMSRRQRRFSINTVTTSGDRREPRKLTKSPPQLPSDLVRRSSTPFFSRFMSSTTIPELPSQTEKVKAVLRPSGEDASANGHNAAATLVPKHHLGSAISTPTRQSEDQCMSQHSRHEFQTDIDYQQAYVTGSVRSKGATVLERTNLPPIQNVETDGVIEPFPDFSDSIKSQHATIVSSESLLPRPTIVIGASSASLRSSVQPNYYARVKAHVCHALKQAQHEELDAKAVVAKAEQDARDNIPALEASTKLARAILREAKAAASQAVEDADVDAAVAAAKHAAEAQAAVMTADRRIAATKIQLKMLISAANARLADAQNAAQAAANELQMIALAEAKAEQDHLENATIEGERIAAEQKPVKEGIVNQRAAKMAAAEAKAIAEVRAALAKAKQESTAQAVTEAESDRELYSTLVKAAAEVKTAPLVLITSPLVTRDPEIREMAARLHRMEESNQMMMQTLIAVMSMGKGLEEWTKVLAEKEMARSDSGIGFDIKAGKVEELRDSVVV